MSERRRKSRALARFFAAAACFSSGASLAQAPPWKPEKPIEIVVNTAPGNSPDRTARSIQRLLRELGLAGAATVSNRVGGGGAVAFGYVGQRPADGHTVAIGVEEGDRGELLGRRIHRLGVSEKARGGGLRAGEGGAGGPRAGEAGQASRRCTPME
ncbi:MAG: hypothetical protein IT529_01920 [Burkholderiales bacterium]|nr:hypothetical protein [Burkholderiales bacterium]